MLFLAWLASGDTMGYGELTLPISRASCSLGGVVGQHVPLQPSHRVNTNLFGVSALNSGPSLRMPPSYAAGDYSIKVMEDTIATYPPGGRAVS